MTVLVLANVFPLLYRTDVTLLVPVVVDNVLAPSNRFFEDTAVDAKSALSRLQLLASDADVSTKLLTAP